MNKFLYIALTIILITFLVGCSSLNQEAKLASPNEEAKEETANGSYYELISVRMSDKSKFSTEDWNEILKLIEKGEIILVDD